MKRMYLFVLIMSLLPMAMRAQSQYQQAVDASLVNLDKSGITSGILYDRVFPAADLREPSQPSSPGHFRQAQAELYWASYNRTDRLTPDDLKSLIWQSEQRNVVPIGVLVADFQVNNTDAIEANNDHRYRLRSGYTNGQLYQTKQAVVASILSMSVAGNPGIGFQIPRWATFSNTNATITTITIDFGDNQIRTFTPGDAPAYVYFASTGEKTINYTIRLSDGTQRSTVSKLTVGGTIANCTTCLNSGANNSNVSAAYPEPPSSDLLGNIEKLVVESDEAFQGYDESSPSKGKANAYFYYAKGRNGNELRKPFIVLDGFDAGDARGPVELYFSRLQYKDQNNVQQFLGDELRKNDPARQNEPDFNSDVVLLNFPNYEIDCVTKTVCVGYTLTGLCNRPEQVTTCKIRDGGVDYIERNALVLVKLITIINQRLQQSGSTEKITIVGPSMGGLISRYALRYMELRGMNHNCKLWVSFDSPHNGANIPIGGQYFLDYFANGFGLEAARAALSSQIDSPASKQLLIHHYRNGENVGGAPGFRDRFVSTMNSFGYPQAACLRKVALVNGSKNGTQQNFGACNQALFLNARLTSGTTNACLLAGLGISFIPLVGPFLGGILAAGCVAGRDRLLEASVYAAPTGANRCLVMRKSMSYFSLESGILERYANGRGGNQPSNDTQPGGYYNSIDQIADQSFVKKLFYQANAVSYFSKATFIPTVSSYGLYDTNRNWGASLVGVNVEADTPFKAISAPDQNEDHVFLTQVGVNFVRDQIREANKNLQACNGGGGGGCILPTNACYTIKSEKSGKRIQAMGDNSVQQQNASGGNDQIWKVDDRGNGQVSFTVQDGTNRAMRSPSGANNFGEGLSLSGYSAGNNQDWKTECNPADASIRRVFFPANNNTWDLQNFGDNPPLGIWGNTSEAFVNYRSFRFEAANCSGGGGASCNFAVSPTTADNNTNRACSQAVTLNANCSGGDCGAVSYSWGGNGINGNNSSVSFNVPGSNGSYPYTVTATKAGCGNQTGSVSLNVSGCGGGGSPCAAFTNGTDVAYRAVGDPNIKVRVVVRGNCKYAVWSDGSEDMPRDWLPYITANPGFSINDISSCLKFNGESCGARIAAEEHTEIAGLNLRVAPNPSNGRFTVHFQTKIGQTATLRLTDLTGRAVRAAQTIMGTGSEHAEVIVLPGSVHGVLLIDMVSGGQRASQKIIID